MSERTRQRRLHVENRLQELRAKFGRDVEALEEWGEGMFGPSPMPVASEPEPVAEQPKPEAKPEKNGVIRVDV